MKKIKRTSHNKSRKTNAVSNESCGISSGAVSVSTHANDPKLFSLVRLITPFLLMFGFCLFFSHNLLIEFGIREVMILLVSATIFTVVFNSRNLSNKQTIIMFSVALVISVLFVISSKHYVAELSEFVRRLTLCVFSAFKPIVLTDYTSLEKIQCPAFMASSLIMLCCVFSFLMVARKKSFCVTITAALLILFSLTSKPADIDGVVIVVLVCAALLQSSVCLSESLTKKHKRNSDIIPEIPKNCIERVSNTNLICTLSMIIAILTLLLLVFPQDKYVPSRTALEFKDSLLSLVDNGTGDSSSAFSGIGNNRLTNSSLTLNSDSALMITGNDLQSVYIKSFCGVSYDGNSWSSPLTHNYDDISTFSYPTSMYFYSQFHDSPCNYFSGNDRGTTSSIFSMTIRSYANNNEFGYYPYMGYDIRFSNSTAFTGNDEVAAIVSPFNDEAYIEKTPTIFPLCDFTIRKTDDNTYDVDYYVLPTDILKSADFKLIDAHIIWYTEHVDPDFSTDMAAYTEFVQNTFTSAGDDTTQEIHDWIGRMNFENWTLGEKIQYVQNYLSNNYHYTLSPIPLRESADFANYFLFESHEGYCMHFATAATLMFREMGVPARYVEGYVLSKEKIGDARKQLAEADPTHDGEMNVVLSGLDAHAWTEIYVEGLGWIPIEVTNVIFADYVTGDGAGFDTDGNGDRAANRTPMPERSHMPDATETMQSDTTPSATNTPAVTDSVYVTPTAGNSEGIEGNKLLNGLLVALLYIGIAAAIVGLFILARLLILRTRKSMFDKKNKKCVRNICAYMIRLLRLSKVSISPSMTKKEVLSALNEHKIFENESDDVALIYSMAEEYRFGEIFPDANSYSKLTDAISEVENRFIAVRKSTIQKLFFAFIFGIAWHKCRITHY